MYRTRCPGCGKKVEVEDLRSARFFPFCSRRCRMADLDRWFTEDYRVPGEQAEPESFEEES